MNIPLVFVHGIRMSGACWEQQRALLPHDAIATPDLPGHGRRRGEPFRMDSAVDVALQAIDDVGGRAYLIGHSMGGYAAIATAARRPEKVAGLLVAGASITPTKTLCVPFRVMHRALSALPDDGDAASARVFRRLFPADVAEPLVDAGIATASIPSVMTVLETYRPLDDLRTYPGPVGLVNGRHDHFRAGERRFLAACQHGSLTVVPRAGHYLPMTRGETFARLVTEAIGPVS